MDRRRFLRTVATAAPLALLPTSFALAASTRVLRLHHLHTGEALNTAYCTGQSFLPDALAAIDHLLRDFRTGDVHAIDPELLDLLHALHAETGSRVPFDVISAYRSPATNAMLRARSTGVASGSLHLEGRAIDIRLPDVALTRLRDAALDLRRGGVGYYPGSNFVHVDTGRIRRW